MIQTFAGFRTVYITEGLVFLVIEKESNSCICIRQTIIIEILFLPFHLVRRIEYLASEASLWNYRLHKKDLNAINQLYYWIPVSSMISSWHKGAWNKRQSVIHEPTIDT